MISEEYSYKLKDTLSPKNLFVYSLTLPGNKSLSAYDAAKILEQSLKFAIRDGHSGRPGNKNTYLYTSTRNAITLIYNEINFTDGLDKTDQNLQKHISDLEEVKKSLENYLEIFVG